MRPDHAYDPSEREASPQRGASPAHAAASSEPWDHDRMCRAAWCRVHGDRAPRELVMREMGIKPGMLEAMLARGEQLSRSPLVERAVPPAEVRKLDQAEEQRRREFRERMHAARARAGASS